MSPLYRLPKEVADTLTVHHFYPLFEFHLRDLIHQSKASDDIRQVPMAYRFVIQTPSHYLVYKTRNGQSRCLPGGWLYGSEGQTLTDLELERQASAFIHHLMGNPQERSLMGLFIDNHQALTWLYRVCYASTTPPSLAKTLLAPTWVEISEGWQPHQLLTEDAGIEPPLPLFKDGGDSK